MKSKICKRIAYSCMSIIFLFSSINVPTYASVTLSSILGTIGYSMLGSAAATVAAHLVDGWLGDDRAYYDAPASNPTYDYSSNSKKFGDIKNSGSDNENCWNTFNTTDNRVKSIVKNSNNNIEVYCPTTNTYETINNISYNYDYDTYNITTNNYNYYITNNYTYVNYYMINIESGEDEYYEIYYELPDGRNSYNLEVNDIWGEYFIYDVVNYDSYREDDGQTLALYHFDGDGKDSSYWQNSDSSLGSGKFLDGKFAQGLYIDSSVYFSLDNVSIGNEFTIEYTLLVLEDMLESDSSNQETVSFIFNDKAYNYRSVDDYVLKAGLYSCAICFDDGEFNYYLNGNRIPMHAFCCSYSSLDDFRSNSPGDYYKSRIFFDVDEGYFEFKTHGIYDYYYDDTHYRPFNYVLDEVRISSIALYDTSIISVLNQPFDTNEVLVLPRQPYESLIAVKGRYDVSNYRIGGVRPTYPNLGDVYIYLEDNKVIDIQQYQGDGWYSIEGSIYKNGEWHDLTKYDLSSFYADEDKDTGGIDDGVTDKEPDTEEPTTEEPTTEEPTTEEPTTEEPSSGDVPGGWGDIDISVSGNDTDSGGGLSGLLDGIGGFFDGIFAIVGKVLEYIGKALTLFSDTIANLISVIPSGVSNLMTALFPFIPKEWVYAIELSLVLSVVAIVIGIFKK